MVVDARAMEWASEQGLDTAKLKAASIPIFGKWYFPDLPANVPMINLKTGEIQIFGSGLRAGEVLYVTQADLRGARLGPYGTLPERGVEPVASPVAEAPVRPAEPDRPAQSLPGSVATEPEEDTGIELHLPGPSIYPLVLAFGVAATLLGLVAGPAELRIFVVLIGLVYLLAGGFGWALQGYRERLSVEASQQDGR